MINQKKVRKAKRNFILQKLQDNGFENLLSDYLFLSCSASVFDDFFLFSGSIIYMVQIIKIINDIAREEKEYTHNIVDCERENDESYIVLKEKYDLFIKKLANILNMIGFEDSMDIGIYLTVMLYNGLLSTKDYFQYVNIKGDNDIYYHEVLGARVMSGYGVCRNMASLFRDVYKEMGYDAHYLSVKTGRFSHATHAVVLVSDEDGNYIIDPTWRTIGLVDENYNMTSNILDLDGYDVGSTYYFKGYCDDSYQYNSINRDFFLNRDKNRRISNKELSIKFKKMVNLCNLLHFCNNDYIDVFFKKPNFDLMNDISNIEQKLTLVKK